LCGKAGKLSGQQLDVPEAAAGRTLQPPQLFGHSREWPNS